MTAPLSIDRTDYIFHPCYCAIIANSSFIYFQNYFSVGDVLGERPSDTETEPFTLHEGLNSTSPETAAERTESFNTVYKTGAWGKGWDPQYKDLNGSGRGRSTYLAIFIHLLADL